MKREEKDIFYEKIKYIISNEEVKKMQKFMQHGSTDTFTHCINVAMCSYAFAKKMKLKVDEDDMLKGALLHDFYLYDWHIKQKNIGGLHAFNHPDRALNNAKKHFDLTKKEENIIDAHMWPLTLRKYPKSKEAVIVCTMDKWCAVLETVYNYFSKIRNFKYNSKLIKSMNNLESK